jgi:hypothetical protein
MIANVLPSIDGTTFCTARSLFGLKIAPDSIDAVLEKGGLGRPDLGVMSMGPHNKQNLLVRGADNALPSPHGGDDEFSDFLVLALEEVAELQWDESPHREIDDLLLLLEENTRLRKLAVQLSNLLGDLAPFTSVTPIGGR